MNKPNDECPNCRYRLCKACWAEDNPRWCIGCLRGGRLVAATVEDLCDFCQGVTSKLEEAVETQRQKVAERAVERGYVTCMGLPIPGFPEHATKPGLHEIEFITVRGVSYCPAYVRVDDQMRLVEVGQQPHVMTVI